MYRMQLQMGRLKEETQQILTPYAYQTHVARPIDKPFYQGKATGGEEVADIEKETEEEEGNFEGEAESRSDDEMEDEYRGWTTESSPYLSGIYLKLSVNYIILVLYLLDLY